MKRMRSDNLISASASRITFGTASPEPSPGSDFGELCSPWSYFKGGIVYAFRTAVPGTTGFFRMFMDAEMSLATYTPGYSAFAECDLSKSQMMNVTVPYSDFTPYRAWDNTGLEDNDPMLYSLVYVSNPPATASFYQGECAADDFGVIHFHACPPIRYTAPPPFRAPGKSKVLPGTRVWNDIKPSYLDGDGTPIIVGNSHVSSSPQNSLRGNPVRK
jgi:hypothetical protein